MGNTISTMSTWKCSNCGLCNNRIRDKCQACFKVNLDEMIPSQKDNQYVLLHRNIKTESQRIKFILIYGYFKQFITSFIPTDIINLCKRFYEEVLYWTIDGNELKKSQKALVSDVYIINGILLVIPP